jgi:hypothetical protein
MFWHMLLEIALLLLFTTLGVKFLRRVLRGFFSKRESGATKCKVSSTH